MKTYEAPTIESIGSIQELTLELDKCGGSGDAFQPLNQILSNDFLVDCDA